MIIKKICVNSFKRIIILLKNSFNKRFIVYILIYKLYSYYRFYKYILCLYVVFKIYRFYNGLRKLCKDGDFININN